MGQIEAVAAPGHGGHGLYPRQADRENQYEYESNHSG